MTFHSGYESMTISRTLIGWRMGMTMSNIQLGNMRPGEGNVSRVESVALEWECSAIYAVTSGFREYFEEQDCSPACWL